MNKRPWMLLCDQLGDNDTTVVKGSTTINRRGENVAITLYQTDILTFTSEGTVILKAREYQTRTTCQVMNQHLPEGIRVTSKSDHWVVILNKDTPGETTENFRDGLTIEIGPSLAEHAFA